MTYILYIEDPTKIYNYLGNKFDFGQGIEAALYRIVLIRNKLRELASLLNNKRISLK